MGRRPLIAFQCIVDGDMSDDIEGVESNIENYDVLGFEVSWSGTSPEGEVFVQFKIKNLWFNLDMDTMAVSGNSGNFAILVKKDSQWEAVRLFYESTSGDGTMQAYVKSTVVGA